MDATAATALGFRKEPIETLKVTEFVLSSVETIHILEQGTEEEAEEAEDIFVS